jgi:hypothetical protein
MGYEFYSKIQLCIKTGALVLTTAPIYSKDIKPLPLKSHESDLYNQHSQHASAKKVNF